MDIKHFTESTKLSWRLWELFLQTKQRIAIIMGRLHTVHYNKNVSETGISPEQSHLSQS